MRSGWRVLAGRIALGLVALAPLAGPAGAEDPSPGQACDAAIRRAEQAAAIPERLLGSMGIVESGRRDPGLGAVRPWPWTIDAAGASWSLPSEAAAIAQVRALQSAGISSIDVGCMQVNLLYHPRAFASLEEAFDPAANAAYAARFLDALHGRDADWVVAAGHYHSETPALARDYARKVLAVWGIAALRPDDADFPPPQGSAGLPVALLPVMAQTVALRAITPSPSPTPTPGAPARRRRAPGAARPPEPAGRAIESLGTAASPIGAMAIPLR
jgi:hypothetical protein